MPNVRWCRGSLNGERDNLASEATRSPGSLLVGVIRPKIRDRRFNSHEDSGDHKHPDIVLDEVGEIRSDDHPKKDATPLQRGDVNRRPHLGSERVHILHLGLINSLVFRFSHCHQSAR
jgi:hypothetical protein